MSVQQCTFQHFGLVEFCKIQQNVHEFGHGEILLAFPARLPRTRKVQGLIFVFRLSPAKMIESILISFQIKRAKKKKTVFGVVNTRSP